MKKADWNKQLRESHVKHIKNYFMLILDVSRKSVDYSQGELWSGRLAKANEVIGVAPVWGRPRRLRYFC